MRPLHLDTMRPERLNQLRLHRRLRFLTHLVRRKTQIPVR